MRRVVVSFVVLALALSLTVGVEPLGSVPEAAAASEPSPTNTVPDTAYVPPEQGLIPGLQELLGQQSQAEPEPPAPDSLLGQKFAEYDAFEAAEVAKLEATLEEVPVDPGLSANEFYETEPGDLPSGEEPVDQPELEEVTDAPVAFRPSIFGVTNSLASNTSLTCEPVPGTPWDGTVSVLQEYAPTTNTADGRYRVRMTNVGTNTWPSGTTISYRIFNSSNQYVAMGTSTTVGSSVSPNGGWREQSVDVGHLSPGQWTLAWDINVPGVGWLTDQGMCSPNFVLTVINQPPSFNYLAPSNGGTATSRQPVLRVGGQDVDAWPSPSNLTYQFKICRNSSFTTGCTTSPWVTDGAWTTPALQWNTQYYWYAVANDGTAQTSGQAQYQSFLTVVPAPDEWRRVGTGLNYANFHGLVMPYGVFVHTASDADITGADFPFSLDRVFSSGGYSQVGAFGRGWSSIFDASFIERPGTGYKTVTYPDGRQENFGLSENGTLQPDAALGSTTTVKQVSGTWIIESGDGFVYEFNSAGQLLRIVQPGGAFVRLQRTNSLVTRIEHSSGRRLEVSWTTPAASCNLPNKQVASITAPALAGQAAASWNYTTNCGVLTSVTAPNGGVYRYETSTYAFKAFSPEDVQTASFSVSTWILNSGTSASDGVEHLFASIAVPGSVHRTVMLSRPTGSGDRYAGWLNHYRGITASYCERRSISNWPYPQESCIKQNLKFDVTGRLRTSFRNNDPEYNGLVSREWYYNNTTGQLVGMRTETGGFVEFYYNAWGELSTSLSYRDANNTVSTTHWYEADPTSTSPRRLDGISIFPSNHGVHGDEFHGMYSYDSVGRLKSYDGPTVPGLPAGEQRSYTYTNATTPAFGSNGVQIPSAQGYAPQGLLSSSTDASGTTYFRYSPQGDLTVEDPPGAGITLRSYDTRGYVASETVNGTSTVDYTRDISGNVVKERYNCLSNEVTGVQSRLIVERAFDLDGREVEVSERAAACSSDTSNVLPARTTTTEYDSFGRVVAVTDPAGGLTTYQYNVAEPSEVSKTIDPRGRETTFARYQAWNADTLVTTADVGVVEESFTAQSIAAFDLSGRMTFETDYLGRKTTYGYSWNDYPIRAERDNGSASAIPLWEREYDGLGNVVEEIRGGTAVHNSYDAEGRLYETTLDPGNLHRTTTILRDGAGRTIGSVVGDANDQTLADTERTTITLDAAGNTTSENVWLSGSSALKTSYIPDVWGNPTAAIDPRGASAADASSPYAALATADAVGRQVSFQSPQVPFDLPQTASTFSGLQHGANRLETVVGYNAFGEVDAVDDNGKITRYEYDAGGRLVTTRLPSYLPPTGPLISPIIARTYNSAGDVLSVTDPLGKTTDYAYDVAGNMTGITGPAVNGSRPASYFQYDGESQLVWTKDPTGVVTTYAYDVLGQLVGETVKKRVDQSNPNSATVNFTTSYQYDGGGNVTAVKTPQSRTVAYTYNAAGEVTSSDDGGPAGPTSYEYDRAGRLARTVFPGGRSAETTYDKAGRVTRASNIAADGTRLDTTFGYDAASNLTTVTDARGTTRTYAFDAASRPTGITQPTSATESMSVAFGYDMYGRQNRVRDGRGYDTWTTYNQWDLPTKVVEPSTAQHPLLSDRSWTYTYDAAGQQVHVTQPGGSTVASEFDALGRVTYIGGSQPGSSQFDVDRSYSYDLNGRLKRAHDDYLNRSVDLAWDDLGNLTSSVANSLTSTFAYDADGLRTSETMTSATGSQSVGYTYKPDGRPATVSNQGTVWNWTYSSVTGDVASVSAGSNSTNYEYDKFGRQNRILQSSAVGTVQDSRYEFDPNGNIVSETSLLEAESGGTYQYDLADRLTQWSPRASDGTIGSIYARHYQWDKSGNRTHESYGAGTDTTTFDERNRPTNVNEDVDGYAFDVPIGSSASGDITTIGARSLTYSPMGELLSDAGVDYTYDPLGRLQSREGQAFRYKGLSGDPYSAPNSLGTGDETVITDAGGRILKTSSTYGTRFSISDLHGDQTAGSTQPGGSRAGAVGFGPFGERWQNSTPPNGTGSAQPSTFGFQGDWTDPSSRSVMMGARWYDPTLGSFLTRDPTELETMRPHDLNRYSYATGNPVTASDPTGLLVPPSPNPSIWQQIKSGAGRVLSDAGAAASRVPWALVGRVSLRVGLRAIPFVGTALLIGELAYLLLTLPEYTAPEQGGPTTTTTERVAPAYGTQTYSSAKVSVSNIGGARVYTNTQTTWTYRTTVSGPGEGARQLMSVASRVLWQRTGAKVIDPTRPGQSHTTATVDVAGTVAAPNQATGPEDGQGCGLAGGTIQSCLAPTPTVVDSCGGLKALAQICTPMAAQPGPPGAKSNFGGASSGSGSGSGAKVPSASPGGSMPPGGGRPPAPAGAPECLPEDVCDDDGPGEWTEVPESMSDNSKAFQEQVTGRDWNMSYVVRGTRFDGYSRGVLLDAKAKYAQFLKDGRFIFNLEQDFVRQGISQLNAAGGVPIRWEVAEAPVAAAIRQLFIREGVRGIEVVHVPPM